MRAFPPLRTAAVIALLLTVAGVGMPATAQDDYPDSGYTRRVDLTFPLPAGSGYQYVDTYFAARSGGRIHRATDIMADKMVPIHAAVAGEICFITGVDAPPPHYGYMITVCGDDGLDYNYIHINNDTPGTDDGQGGAANAYPAGIREGVRVERGQHIAWVGDSGNAESTGSHLHLSIEDDELAEQDGYLNPYPSLTDAEGRGDFPVAGGQPSAPPAPAPTEAPPTQEPDPQPTVTETEEPTPAPGPSETEEPEPSEQPQPTPTASDQAALPSTRLAGASRIQTSVALSQHAFDDTIAVIIVPAGSHVEALVAAPLAGLIDSPVLLANPDGLDDAVMDEIRRLGAPNAYIIGTTGQLSAQVEDDLAASGVQNQARISREDRYQLSADVAREILSYPQVDAIDEVILALGDADEASRAWPDALSASALAAHTSTPILLTEGDRLPDPIADLLTELRPGAITVVGGTAAIAADVAAEAAALAAADLTRLAGASRYGTSVAVAAAARAAGLGSDDVWVATGRNFPDALAAGPASAAAGAPLILIDGLEPSGGPESAAWIRDNADAVMVVGGSAVITDDVLGAL